MRPALQFGNNVWGNRDFSLFAKSDQADDTKDAKNQVGSATVPKPIPFFAREDITDVEAEGEDDVMSPAEGSLFTLHAHGNQVEEVSERKASETKVAQVSAKLSLAVPKLSLPSSKSNSTAPSAINQATKRFDDSFLAFTSCSSNKFAFVVFSELKFRRYKLLLRLFVRPNFTLALFNPFFTSIFLTKVYSIVNSLQNILCHHPSPALPSNSNLLWLELRLLPQLLNNPQEQSILLSLLLLPHQHRPFKRKKIPESSRRKQMPSLHPFLLPLRLQLTL
jgi:hypothetical protein